MIYPTRTFVFVAAFPLMVLAHLSAFDAPPNAPSVKLKKIFDRKTKEKPDILAFSGDGKTMAIFTQATLNDFVLRSPCTVQIMNLKNGKTSTSVIPGTSGARSCAVSPDGKSFAMSGLRGVEVWDAQRGKVVRRLELANRPGQPALYAGDAKFGASGKYVTASYADFARVWNLQTGNFFALKPNPAPERKPGLSGVHFAPKGDCLLIEVYNLGIGRDGISKSGVAVWSTKTAKPIGIIHLTGATYAGVAVSQDGATAIGRGRETDRLLVWDLTNALKQKTPKKVSVKLSKIISFGKGRKVTITAFSLSPDGKIVAAGISNRNALGQNPGEVGDRLAFVDVATGNPLKQIDYGAYRIGAITFRPDGKLVATASGAILGIGGRPDPNARGKVTIWSLQAAN